MRAADPDASAVGDSDLRMFLIALVYKAGGQVDLTHEEIYQGWAGPTGFPRAARAEVTTTGMRITVTPRPEEHP